MNHMKRTMLKNTSESIASNKQFFYALITVLYKMKILITTRVERSETRGLADRLKQR